MGLERALERREIEVLFQPQFACSDGAVVGAEALARWHHPTLGEVGASELFAIAESAQMVAAVSRHVAARALEEAAHWPENLGLSVNIAPEELNDPQFAGDFAEMADGSTFAPERLTLEVTEDLLLCNLEQASNALTALRSQGFRTALDDFGSGYCNFQYLKELPLDVLKLDRVMLEGVPENPRDLAVLRALVAMGNALGLAVVVEGVENEDQRETVRREGCTYWQGFLRAAPMNSDEVLGLVAAPLG